MNIQHYNEEHNPYNSNKAEDSKCVEFRSITAGRSEQRTLTENELIFIQEGAILVSYGDVLDKEYKKGTGFLLLAETQCKIFVKKAASIIIMQLKTEVFFSCNISLVKIENENQFIDYNNETFRIKPKLSVFFKNLEANIKEDLNCDFYLNLKIKELLFVIGYYYSKAEILALFYPLMSKNTKFSDFVLKNCQKAKTVVQLASMYSYSVSSFEKEFRRVFGLSAHKWMTRRRVRMLFHEINSTQKPLRQICEEYGFSLSQFNDYCKKHFGVPPGRMRRGEQQNDRSNGSN